MKSFTGMSDRMFWKLCDTFTGGEIAIKTGMNHIIIELVSVKSLYNHFCELLILYCAIISPFITL